MEFLAPQHWRASWGVLLPSPNTATEPDFWAIAPHGITFHSARIGLTADMEVTGGREPDPATSFHNMLRRKDGRQIYKETLEMLATTRPSHMIWPISSESMMSGLEGAKEIQADFERWSGGISVTVGGLAFVHALRTLGVSKVAILSCHFGSIAATMNEFLTEAGFEIVHVHEVPNESTREILIGSSDDDLLEVATKLDGANVDVFLQLGANMSLLGLIDKVESRLGKPCLTNNATVLWSAMRTQGFNDSLEGLGTLWRDH